MQIPHGEAAKPSQCRTVWVGQNCAFPVLPASNTLLPISSAAHIFSARAVSSILLHPHKEEEKTIWDLRIGGGGLLDLYGNSECLDPFSSLAAKCISIPTVQNIYAKEP